MNFFPLFKGMKNSSDFKMKMASLAGVGICTLAYLLVGILGYSLLGSKV
jgi:amino acid permease